MRRRLSVLLIIVVLLGVPTAASAHEEFGQLRLDHPAPPFVPGAFPNPFFLSEGGEWDLLASIPTGNPHTDLDFFTKDGDVYASVGTLAVGPNAGGQTIVRLTEDGEVAPSFVAGHPSASCISDPASATGLQHDVEATPKGDVLFNTDWNGLADTRDAQLLLDATDAVGRCHDQGTFGLSGAPRGGLEVIDVTDVTSPVELVLTSHIGQAHTVNVDPKRPHIAYVVTSDQLAIVTDTNDLDGDGDTEELIRANEDPASSDRFDLDGWEMVDLSSCMDFAEGTDLATKRESCNPLVYRYRYPLGVSQGTYNADAAGGCHELEVYPDDTLTCAALESSAIFDLSGAFDDRGTPDDYTDDTIRGVPLPCARRSSSSAAPFGTGAAIIDCVNGVAGVESLTVPAWLAAGAPSVEGIEVVGFVPHGGRTLSNSAADGHSPAEDVSIAHEAELTHSGKFLIVSDERGGGIVPPDASCPTPGVQPAVGNGGLHAYVVNDLFTEYPGDPRSEDATTIAERAYAAYARTPGGDKAIIRAEPIVPARIFCTAHVFHQIPGQNRIFMAWYEQGTRVIDYVEHPDGSFEFREVAYFIPANASQWVSAVFHVEDNGDGTFTYTGAAGDFNLGDAGRNTVDVWQVTLPAPAQTAVGEQPAPQPAPQPEPAPQPAPSTLPATGGGLALAAVAVLAASVAGLRRRHP